MQPDHGNSDNILDSQGNPVAKPKRFTDRVRTISSTTRRVVAVLAAFLAFSAGVFTNIDQIRGWFVGNAEQETSVKSSQESRVDEAEQDERKNDVVNLDAPIVTFSDGTKAAIEFAVATSVKEYNAPIVVVRAGSRELALRVLDPVTESAVIALMESTTLGEARRNRNVLQDSLVAQLKPKFLFYGITLDALSLKEFNEVGN